MKKSLAAWEFLRGFEPFSLCDWPGRTSCVLFFGGCNLKCPTCHNHVLAWNWNALPKIEPWRLKTHLAERGRWLDGITITGGEPTIVPGIDLFLEELKAFDLPVKMDTNGMRPATVERLLNAGLVDTFAVDVKGPFVKYFELCGRDIQAEDVAARLESIFRMARNNPRAFYFRTTQVPSLGPADMDVARSYLPEGFELKLQEYREPRREEHAVTDSQTRRETGDMVHGPHRTSHSQSPEPQWNQRPAIGPAFGQESRDQA